MSSCRSVHWLIGSQIQTPFPLLLSVTKSGKTATVETRNVSYQVPALQLYRSGASAAVVAVVVVVEADDALLAAVVEPVLGVAQEQAAKVAV